MKICDELFTNISNMARSVCFQKYIGHRINSHITDFSFIQKIESARLKMTDKGIEEFGVYVSKVCREAHEQKLVWFVNCIKSRPSQYQDQLYMRMLNWLSSYLTNPQKFKRNYKKNELEV